MATNGKLDSLSALYVEQLQDLYSAEQQITKALPKMAKHASSEKLSQAFEEHLAMTQEQITRLDQIFEELGEKPGGHTCKAMEGLVKEGEELMQQKADPDVMDAALIAAAQKVEHYEIAGYGTVATWAEMLDQGQAATLLRTTLEEEGQTDKRLTKLAEGSGSRSGINKQAM
jgi:ferritin-like metal-binding protein YciE